MLHWMNPSTYFRISDITLTTLLTFDHIDLFFFFSLLSTVGLNLVLFWALQFFWAGVCLGLLEERGQWEQTASVKIWGPCSTRYFYFLHIFFTYLRDFHRKKILVKNVFLLFNGQFLSFHHNQREQTQVYLNCLSSPWKPFLLYPFQKRK